MHLLSLFALPLLLTLMVPWLSALYPSFSPWPCSLLKHCWSPSLPHSPSISNSFPLWFVYMLSLLILFLLPTRDLSPVHGTVLGNLEIDLFLWDGPDIVCSWTKRKCHLGCSLFLHFIRQCWERISGCCFFFLQLWIVPKWKKHTVILLYPKDKKGYSLKWLQMKVNYAVSYSCFLF